MPGDYLGCIFAATVLQRITHAAFAGNSWAFFSQAILEAGPATTNARAEIAARSDRPTAFNSRAAIEVSGIGIVMAKVKMMSIFFIEQSVTLERAWNIIGVNVRLTFELAFPVQIG